MRLIQWILAATLFLIAEPAWATTYYVRPSGAGGNCTAFQTDNDANASNSIKTAMACTSGPGDVVQIATGTYTETLFQAGSLASGNSSNPVIVQKAPGATVTWRPSSGGGAINLDGSYSWITFDGLILDGQNLSPDGTLLRFCGSANNITFTNGQILNSTGQGVTSCDGSTIDSITISNSRINNNGNDSAPQEHGLYFASGNNIRIEFNEIDHNFCYGVHSFSGTSGANTNHIIRRNYIHDNANGCTATSYGIIVAAGTGHKIRHNFVIDNDGGIQIEYGGTVQADVYNNVVYSNSGVGIDIGFASSGTNVRNNIIRNNASVITDNGASTTKSENNCSSGVAGCSQTSDPLFISVAGNNFCLQDSSPAIDVGVNVSLPFNGLLPDIGACETALAISASTVDASNVDVTLGSAFAPFTPTTPPATPWTLKVNSVSKSINSVTRVGNATYRLNCTACMAAGNTITVSHDSGTTTITDQILIGNSKNQRLSTFTDFSVTNTLSGGGGIVLSVEKFRCRDWAKNTTTNTAQDWLAPENTNCTARNDGAKIALIHAVACNGGNCSAEGFRHEFNTNGGGFANVTNSCATNNVCYDSSNGQSPHGTTITPTLLTNPEPAYVAGAVSAQDSSYPVIDLSQDSATNIQVNLSVKSGLANGTVLCVRPKPDSVTGITHTVTSCFTIVNPSASQAQLDPYEVEVQLASNLTPRVKRRVSNVSKIVYITGPKSMEITVNGVAY